ncbi:MAG: thiamine biosynthesis protein ApbE [Clostridia bacterium BRH_c25]|nr:MAG: thiamine biosynthesis protein ApbE [Clostridia bacterium BRH_c25]
MYQERSYRKYMRTDELQGFNVCEFESDLQIFTGSNLEKEARNAVIKYRRDITEYIKKNPKFIASLSPVEAASDAPGIVQDMCRAAQLANVGPMAAIAGAVSKYVGRHLLQFTDEVIVENGGDIYVKSKKDRRILVYAGSSPFSNKLALLVPGCNRELGICTSSGTVGHSLSFGKADAAVILSKNAVLADAAATAVGNVVKDKNDIEAGIEYAMSIQGVDGVLIIVGDKMGACGDAHIIKA